MYSSILSLLFQILCSYLRLIDSGVTPTIGEIGQKLSVLWKELDEGARGVSGCSLPVQKISKFTVTGLKASFKTYFLHFIDILLLLILLYIN